MVEKKYLKQLVQILQEREHEFKEDISNLKNQLEKARNTEGEISNQLKEQTSNCRKLEAEKEESISSQKGGNEEKIKKPKEKICSNSEGSCHQNQEVKNEIRKAMRNVRCFNYHKFGHIYANFKSKITRPSQQKKQSHVHNS